MNPASACHSSLPPGHSVHQLDNTYSIRQKLAWFSRLWAVGWEEGSSLRVHFQAGMRTPQVPVLSPNTQLCSQHGALSSSSATCPWMGEPLHLT